MCACSLYCITYLNQVEQSMAVEAFEQPQIYISGFTLVESKPYIQVLRQVLYPRNNELKISSNFDL